MSSFRRWNTGLDSVFYNVNGLTEAERQLLTSGHVVEGYVLTVFPAADGREIESACPHEFVDRQKLEPDVETVVVAGVGSSPLGAAALARDVADYLNAPVAAIVSGFGVADLVSEALGGWFVLGARNSTRDLYARWLDTAEWNDDVRDDETHHRMKETFDAVGIDTDRFLYGAPDSASLLYILSMLQSGIQTLIGHSKGNLSIENALEGLLEARRRTGLAINTDVCVVTLGAVTRFPEEFSNVHQFIGDMDYFGLLNSRPRLPRVVMPDACHSLNPQLPMHLDVAQALRLARV